MESLNRSYFPLMVTREIQILIESEGRDRYVAVALSQSGSSLAMAKRYFLRPVSSATYSLLELAGDWDNKCT